MAHFVMIAEASLILLKNCLSYLTARWVSMGAG